MSGLLPEKVLSIFLNNPAYERDGFMMWGFILKKYYPRGKDALLESVSVLYTLEQTKDESISAYMSRAHRFFSSLHQITFNTMANLFVIVSSDRSRFIALANCFCSDNPEVVNSDVDRIETLLESIESRSRIIDGLPTPKPSALRGSDPRSESIPAPPPKSDCPKTTAPPGGTHSRYPPMRPKWDKVTDLAKAEKVCCACFCVHTWAQGCVPLAHSGLVIGNDPKGAQGIISAYTEKKKTWEDTKRHLPTYPKPRGQHATSSDRSSLPPDPAIDPPRPLTAPTTGMP